MMASVPRFIGHLKRTRDAGLDVSEESVIELILGAIPMKYWVKVWQYGLDKDHNILHHLFQETHKNVCELFRDLQMTEITTKDQEVFMIESDTEPADSDQSVTSEHPIGTWSESRDDPMEEDSTDNAEVCET